MLGWFDSTAQPLGWSDETAQSQGWFDRDLLATAAEEPPPEGAPPLRTMMGMGR